mgnify:FL=1
MKIGYFADDLCFHRVIELIAETDGLEIVFIVPAVPKFRIGSRFNNRGLE